MCVKCIFLAPLCSRRSEKPNCDGTLILRRLKIENRNKATLYAPFSPTWDQAGGGWGPARTPSASTDLDSKLGIKDFNMDFYIPKKKPTLENKQTNKQKPTKKNPNKPQKGKKKKNRLLSWEKKKKQKN